MPTNWRTLFDDIGIHWVDRGPNARRGNVNIGCPWCGTNDPSEHLQVSESDRGYYCLRDPNRHRGTDYITMMIALLPHATRAEIARLLNAHSAIGFVDYEAPKKINTDIAHHWSQFIPAATMDRCLEYLYKRGFNDPRALCRMYDLRYCTGGYWSMRLLIPVSVNGTVVSWTGRALASHVEPPRYLMPRGAQPGLLYIPRAMRAIGIVVEGPIDALKIAAATEHMPITPVALMGLNLDPAKVESLRAALHGCHSVYICLDTQMYQRGAAGRGFGQTITQFRELQNLLAKLTPPIYIDRLALPGSKDAGEMRQSEIVSWLAATVA